MNIRDLSSVKVERSLLFFGTYAPYVLTRSYPAFCRFYADFCPDILRIVPCVPLYTIYSCSENTLNEENAGIKSFSVKVPLKEKIGCFTVMKCKLHKIKGCIPYKLDK